MDFDDLLLLARELLQQNVDIRNQLQERIHHLLIDEYQDTNPLQLSLIQLLASPQCQVCAVGDDDQAIYAFRGANIENILRFEQDFAPCRVIKLEENYRSYQNILTAAHGVISKNPHRKGKKLFSNLGPGNKIKVLECEDGSKEAETVALNIHDDLHKRGMPAHNIALLYRANPQSRLFEESLRQQAIPYKIVGGTSFFDTKEVKNLLAWLSLIDYPGNEMSFRRMVNFPARGIGHKTLERLVDNAPQAKQSFLAFSAAGAPGLDLKKTAQQSLISFAAPLFEAAQAAQKAHPRQMVAICERAIQDAGYKRWVAEEKDPKIRDRIREAHQGFFDALALFCEQYEEAKSNPRAHESIDTKRSVLRAFLQKLSLEDKEDLREEDKSKTSKGKVTLMSLHAAKGLEFEKVYLVGFEEGLLPHRRSLEESGDTGVQEERRLCYVGITRAKAQLVLSYAQWRRRRHERIKREPSRFLENIPAKTLDTPKPIEETEEETAFNAFASLKARLSKNEPVESHKEIS
ncbi:MAG: ATP-dependent DNA helicase Rep [Myxococcales bacterium]|nr:ATP-dependent DNA helicase Rep [Myxococcales bacterium]